MAQKTTKTLRIALFIGLMLIIVLCMRLVTGMQAASTKYVPLAQCLTEKNVKFYGAFWCTHCGEQKAAFGAAASALPYVECSNPDHSQNEACTAAGVQNRYPTWVFPDGTRHEGGLSPKQLGQMSGCAVTGAR